MRQKYRKEEQPIPRYATISMLDRQLSVCLDDKCKGRCCQQIQFKTCNAARRKRKSHLCRSVFCCFFFIRIYAHCTISCKLLSSVYMVSKLALYSCFVTR